MKPPVKKTAERSPAMRRLEAVLLCIVMGLMVLRATVIENPHIDQPQTRLLLTSEIVSLTASTVLLVCFGLWLLCTLLLNQFHWRKTGFGWAVGVFFLAGVLSAFFASNKRAAVTDIVTLLTPMLTGLLLVQLLDTRQTIRLTLLLILAVGAAAAVQCIDQLMASNETLIADYEAHPVEHLQKLGIEPDSMEHWMYQHRLYSKGIRGFLLTSNSTASFFLLAVFAALGLCAEAMTKSRTQEQWAAAVCYGLATAICGAGVLMTQSKGGIGSLLLGLMLLVALFGFGRTIWRHRRLCGILVLLGAVLAAGGIIAYGVRHGRLPGGNAMLVRWQYWKSAAQMIQDHPLAGVGGGNFIEFYTRYKNPAASETVLNPHNWILSLLSQYGPLGLLAFLGAALWPLWKSFQSRFAASESALAQPALTKGPLWAGLLAVCGCTLLFVRPAWVDTEFLYQNVDVRAAAYLVLYLVPAGVFVLAFVLLWAASVADASVSGRNDRLVTALICGLVAVMIHNLIDFALFEPGVWGLFWLLIAILAAERHIAAGQKESLIILDAPKRFGAAMGLLLALLIYVIAAFVPPIRANQLFRQAMRDDARRIELIDKAIAADPLSPRTAYAIAGMFTQTYITQGVKEVRFLSKALDYADIAARRNPADFKPWRLRAKISVIRSEQTEGQVKEAALERAFEDLQQAIVRYPGSDKLYYLLANVAEQLGRNDIALCYYQTAVDIENAYRVQFRMMYPDRPTVISRLGNDAYAIAKAKIEELQKELQE
jgi:hypothetical protein